MNDNQLPLTAMRVALNRHVAGTASVAELVSAWRSTAGLLTLPPVYGEAMDELLRRLEMSAAFTQDSCSFSAKAITDQLGRWLDKAETV